jgi:Proteasome assembly chaperone 4
METASSKLIGSDSEESEMVARHMASRLSHKLGVAVFVSCSFDEIRGQGMDADEFDEDSLQQRAAAAAEQEIHRLLKVRFSK